MESKREAHPFAGSAEQDLNVQLQRSYDEMPYRSVAFAETDLDHLRTVAHLFGLSAPPAQTARVLEIGCASGGNLIPMALRYPQARFAGLDLSLKQVEQGRAQVAALGLKNVDIHHVDVRRVKLKPGNLDYIICHGVFSWVPPEVQRGILRLCGASLAPGGVAYISYNTYPGWKGREILRDAMLLRAGGRRTPAERLGYARGMLDFLQQTAAPGSLVRQVVDDNMAGLRSASNDYLLHEYLESCNQPFYLRSFVEQAQAQGLVYLGDAHPSTMFAYNHGAEVAEPLLQEVSDQVSLEQYLDFVTGRSFRSTLLVRADSASGLRYDVMPERMASLHVAGRFTPAGGVAGEAAAGGAAPQGAWQDWRGMAVQQAQDVLSQALMQAMSQAWPSTLSVPVLRDASAAALQQPGLTLEAVCQALLPLWVAGHVRARTVPVLCDRPTADVVRLSPKAFVDGDRVVTAWHQSVPLSDLAQAVLTCLRKGPVARAALLQYCLAQVVSGALQLLDGGVTVEWTSDPSRASTLLAHELDILLQDMQDLGLLTS